MPLIRIPSALAITAIAGLTYGSATAGVVFSESFEAPVVVGFDDNTVPSGGKWTGATLGFGASDRGLYNEAVSWPATSAFSTPYGSQAYLLNYSNSGLTTSVGATGQTLTAGVAYQVTFNAAVATGTASGSYLVELVAFAASDDNARRTDCQGTRPGTILATATGSVTTTDMSATGSLTFTADGANAHLGKDLGIRLVKASNNVLYDNIRMVTGHDMNPSPASGVTMPAGNTVLSWTNMPPTPPASNTPVDVWFGSNPASLTQVVDGVITSTTNVNAPAAGTYYWRVDSYLDGNPNGTPVIGDIFFFVVIDTDGDGLPDAYELANTTPPSATGLNPLADLESDGLTNALEYFYGTNPNVADTDGDTLPDGPELTGVGSRPATSPVKFDTDSDGLSDGVETNTGSWVSAANTGTNPADADWDNDGLKDGAETNTGTFVDRFNTGSNPFLVDTDVDGTGDWYEAAAAFTNPSNATSKPAVPYPLPDPDGATGVTNKPVKVYIMAGQSNTVGIGRVNGTELGTLETITKRENKFPNLLDGSNNWLPRNDVLYRGVVSATAKGPLAPGQGASGTQLGPELGFGHIMGWYHDEPVLIIKASQGNRSLGWDFLPPGSARWSSATTTYAGYGESPQTSPTGIQTAFGSWYGGKQYDDCFSSPADTITAPPAWQDAVAYAKDATVLHNDLYYICTTAHTSAPATEPDVGAGWTTRWKLYENAHSVLAKFGTLYPQWAAQGYEIAGFCWWQGHKDQDGTNNIYATRYQENLVNLINALRADFNAPNAPVVVATIGFGGEPLATKQTDFQQVFNAQMAVQGLSQFAGTVKSVDILKYWRTVEESPLNQDYHYNQNAETYMLVGDAMGRAMLEMQDDVAPPSPDPMSFIIAPTAVNTTTVGMVATTAVDVSGPVQYYFENTTNSGVNNSGWITSTSWNNTGLSNGVSYNFRVKARDNKLNETAWSATVSAAPGTDVTAPAPSPMSFEVLPTAQGENAITMTATTATDINGVQYFFECTAGGGPNSAWQSSRVFTANGLAPATQYTYVVRARDSVGNITGNSPAASATTATPDTAPPSPTTMSFANPPTAVGTTAISMTATTATDVSGVQYFFEASGGGTSSTWQDSPSYTDTSLSPGTEYGYRVRARDKSPAGNLTAWSETLTATTEVPDETPPTPNPMTFAVAPTATGANSITMTATTATDANGVEYQFTNVTLATESAWQPSPVFTSTGLQPETQYIYHVKARDTSDNFNETAASATAAATTTAAPTGPGGAVIYEPFVDGNSSLAGNAPGVGLSGTWTAGASVVVDSGSLIFGALPVSDNRIRNSTSVGTTQGVAIGPELAAAGLLADNAELWFSFLVNNPSGSNVSFDFAIGTSTTGFSGMGTNEQGIGVTLASGTGIRASTFNSGRSSSATGSTLTAGTTALIVGKINWGGNAGAEDTIRIYRPTTNLLLPATAVATKTAILNQSLFDTITTYFKDPNVQLDEIRFGATYEAAIGQAGAGPGPVASFTISPIASPQTVGTPITGITLTAKDASNATATGFTGTVTFGGTGGFTGTSANFVAGVLTNVSVTPSVAGSDLTLTVSASDKTGSASIATISPAASAYDSWASGAAFAADANGDGVNNGIAWVLGALDPSVDANDKLPKASRNGSNLRLTFRCLKSSGRSGVGLKVQSSNDLGATDPWTSHEAAVPDADGTVGGVIFDTTEDGDYIDVIADIPAGSAKLFARLIAVEP